MNQLLPSSHLWKLANAGEVMRHGILVTGMHRSGTSALTRVLSMMGCALPQTLMCANDANPVGYWESNAICALNDELLDILGRSWNDWAPIDAKAFTSLPVRALQPMARALLSEEFSDASLFVLKDPRIAILTPFWLDTFTRAGIRPGVVCPVRHPIEVARSLANRDGIDEAQGHLIWLRHALTAEAATRGLSRTFTTYDQLLGDWRSVVERIANDLQVIWPRSPASQQADIGSFLADALRHHAVGASEACGDAHLSQWTRTVHAILARWAKEGEADADHAALDEITAMFDAAAPAFGGLVARGTAAITRLRTVEADTEVSGATAEAPDLDAPAAGAEAEVQAFRDHVHDLESRLRERDEELAQVWADLSAAQAAGDLHAADAKAMAERLAEAERWVFRLAGERQAAEQKLAADQAATAKMRQERDQAHAALTRAQDEIAVARDKLKALDVELAAAVAARAEALREMHGVIELMTVQAQARVDVISGERDEAQASFAVAHARAEAAEARCHEHATLLEAAQTEFGSLARMVADANAATALERAGREWAQAEIEGLNTRVATEAHRAEEYAEASGWLAEVAATLQQRTWWWAFLPPAYGEAKLLKRLKRRGLFDGDAYLALYPDVAANGASPIRHYLHHGFHEKRERPA